MNPYLLFFQPFETLLSLTLSPSLSPSSLLAHFSISIPRSLLSLTSPILAGSIGVAHVSNSLDDAHTEITDELIPNWGSGDIHENMSIGMSMSEYSADRSGGSKGGFQAALKRSAAERKSIGSTYPFSIFETAIGIAAEEKEREREIQRGEEAGSSSSAGRGMGSIGSRGSVWEGEEEDDYLSLNTSSPPVSNTRHSKQSRQSQNIPRKNPLELSHGTRTSHSSPHTDREMDCGFARRGMTEEESQRARDLWKYKGGRASGSIGERLTPLHTQIHDLTHVRMIQDGDNTSRDEVLLSQSEERGGGGERERERECEIDRGRGGGEERDRGREREGGRGRDGEAIQSRSLLALLSQSTSATGTHIYINNNSDNNNYSRSQSSTPTYSQSQFQNQGPSSLDGLITLTSSPPLGKSRKNKYKNDKERDRKKEKEKEEEKVKDRYKEREMNRHGITDPGSVSQRALYPTIQTASSAIADLKKEFFGRTN